MTWSGRSAELGWAAAAFALTLGVCILVRIPVSLAVVAAGLIAAAALPATLFTPRHKRPRILLLLVAIALGLGRAAFVLAVAPGSLTERSGQTVVLLGTVSEIRGSGWVVEIDRVIEADREEEVNESVLLSVSTGAALHVGDHIQTQAVLRTPGTRSGAQSVDALDRIGVDMLATASTVDILSSDWTAQRVLGDLRAGVTDAVNRVLSPPVSSLALGVVFGIHQTLPTNVTADLQQTGLYHIVAVSGLKVVIMVGLLTAWSRARQWSRRRTLIVSGLTVVAYVILAGAGAAAVRSAVMSLLALFLQRGGRRIAAMPLLALLAGVVLALSPRAVRDAGFQLSYVGTAAIMLWAEPIAARLPGPRWFAEPFAVTVAAQVATTPIMAATFGVVSLVGPLANAVVLPFLPAVMIVGICGGFLSLVSSGLALICFVPLAWALAAMCTWAHLLASIPGTSLAVSQWPTGWLLAEGAGAVVLVLLYRRFRSQRQATGLPPVPGHGAERRPLVRRGRKTVALAAAVMTSLTVAWLSQLPDGRLRVTLLDVGSAPAILVRAPQGGLALVDGGSSATQLDAALGRQLLPTAHRIDLVVLTDGSTTAISALKGLTDRYAVDEVVAVGPISKGAQTLLDAFQASGATVVGDGGHAPWEWNGLRWDAFVTTSGAVSLRVSQGSSAALLLGNSGTPDQEDIVAAFGSRLAADLVIAPPGGAVSTSLIDVVHPQWIAAPAGKTAASAATVPWAGQIARTGVTGDLTYVSDGSRFTTT